MTETSAKRSFASRLKALYRSEGIFSGIWLALRFFHCWIYRFRFAKADSFFIRGMFSIRRAKYISIGTLRAGTIAQIEDVRKLFSYSYIGGCWWTIKARFAII